MEFTIFFPDGTHQIVIGETIEDACEKNHMSEVALRDTFWRYGDATWEYKFDKKTRKWKNLLEPLFQ